MRTSRSRTGTLQLSANFLVRIVGMLVLAYLGRQIGLELSNRPQTQDEVLATQLLMLCGAGLGLLTSHKVLLEPLVNVQRRARTAPILEVVTVAAGVLMGLIFAVLLTVPLSHLPAPLETYLPIASALLFGYLGGVICSGRRREIYEAFMANRRRGQPATEHSYLLDTSTIIDGRIATVLRTGFLAGNMIVPRFVLNELHLLADSQDAQKRGRGKRGLDILNRMQKEAPLPVEISNLDAPQAPNVDQKLVAVAQQNGWPIITNDYNLNRVAELQNVQVLSLNELAEAVRLPIQAGDLLQVEIREEGREREQGVGYLDDGTMVVVEDARNLIGQHVAVIVSRVWQTDRGRMIFGRLGTNERYR